MFNAYLIGVILTVGLSFPPAGDGSIPSIELASPAATSVVGVDPAIETQLEPTITSPGASPAERVRVDEAVGRFRDVGLRLPDLEVLFHDDDASCKGHDGRFQSQFTPWRLLVCTEADFVLTHEMAHAWEAANLDDEDRQRYLAHRRLDSWSDPEDEWRERGVEDAAFMLQQNLMMRPTRIDTERWSERLAAYEQLTGTTSPILAADRSSVPDVWFAGRAVA